MTTLSHNSPEGGGGHAFDVETIVRQRDALAWRMQPVVDEVLTLVPRANGAAIVCGRAGRMLVVCGAGAMADHVGLEAPLDASLTGRVMVGGQHLVCDDVAANPIVVEPIRTDERIGSMLLVPLKDGAESIGVLALSAALPGAFEQYESVLRVADFAAVTLAATINAVSEARRALDLYTDTAPEAVLGRTEVSRFFANVISPGTIAAMEARLRVESVLRDEPIRTVVQPIVDLRTGVVRSAESFTRFLDVPYRSPDVWFAEASAVGLGCEMQELALRRGLETLQVVPPTISVGFNVSWDMLVSGQVSALFAGAGVATDRVCVEISEHREVSSYEEARREVAALRELGADVTIDRVGSGLSSLHQVIELAPGAIKLDRYFICGLDRDAARRAMVEAFAHFSSRTGIDLIAEGLETAAELEAARRLGIRYGQGYVIARPDAPESMPAEYPEIGRRAGD